MKNSSVKPRMNLSAIGLVVFVLVFAACDNDGNKNKANDSGASETKNVISLMAEVLGKSEQDEVIALGNSEDDVSEEAQQSWDDYITNN